MTTQLRSCALFALVFLAACSNSCPADPAPMCLDDGEVCTDGADCCNENCLAGTCSSETCLADGESCLDSVDCCGASLCNGDGVCEAEVVGPSCFECACVMIQPEGGCADICDGDINGTGTPNFCQGAPALSQCEACIRDLCGSEWLDCN